MIYCNWLIFNMFSASFLEKALFRPFVFKKFSGSCFCLVGGHEAAMQSVGNEARKMCIISPFLLRGRGRGPIRCRGGFTPPLGEVNSPLPYPIHLCPKQVFEVMGERQGCPPATAASE